MKTVEEEYVEFDEEKIVKKGDQLICHPLSQLYRDFQDFKHDRENEGDLTFAGNYLDKSPLLDDMKFFELRFYGEPINERYREEWADPLRAEVLERLTKSGRSWYISFIGPITEYILGGVLHEFKFSADLYEYLKNFDSSHYREVKSLVPYGKDYTIRRFYEIPNVDLHWVIPKIWECAYESFSIQGFNLPSSRVDLFEKWNKQEWDDKLFSEVLDQSYLMFYTTPAEHYYFRFLTNKLDYEKMSQLLDINSLRKMAEQILETG